MPATTVACRRAVRVTTGRQIQLRGRGLYRNMRVTFRWPRGALATRLRRSGAGWTARVPAGTARGRVAVTVRDRARRRSNARHIIVVAAPSPARPSAAAGTLPDAMRGDGMWIWQLPQSEGGDLDAIAARAKAAGMTTVYVKSADAANVWKQFTPRLVQGLHARGLRVCAWQFVYGKDPLGEAAAAAANVATGADCFVIDAETTYEGRYASAQRYVAGAARADRPRLPARADLVSVRRLPPELPVLGVPRARRRAGQPAAGLLEGDRRLGRRRQREDRRAEPRLRRADRPARARPTAA